jgi:hypothetical protein
VDGYDWLARHLRHNQQTPTLKQRPDPYTPSDRPDKPKHGPVPHCIAKFGTSITAGSLVDDMLLDPIYGVHKGELVLISIGLGVGSYFLQTHGHLGCGK